MYKFDNGQLSIDEFGQPIGMKLHQENRWVKKAATIPWSDIEKRYAALFTNQKGNVAKPLRLGLGACIIQAEYGFSDVEVTRMLQEHPYLQYFCGYKAYDDSKPPFDPSLMVYFRKRLTPEILGEINEMILAAQNADENDADDHGDSNDDEGGNSGTMIVDATCAPSQIKYPQDTALLNEARENTEALIDALHITGEKKPRTYRKRAHKDYLALVRSRKPNKKKIRKAVGQQLRYLRRNLGSIDAMLANGGQLTARQQFRLETIRKVYEQQKTMYDARNHKVSDRIVSLSQPWLRPIVRGKAGAAVESGAKLDISVVNGWNFAPLMPTTRPAICRICWSASKSEPDTIRPGYWRIKSTAIGRTSPIARSAASASAAPRWVDKKRIPSPINGKITGTNASAWKSSGASP